MMAMWYFTADLTSDTIVENIFYSKSQVRIPFLIPLPLQTMGTIRTLTFNKPCNPHPYFVKVHLENGRGFMNVTVIDPQTNQRTDDASVEAYIAQQLSLPVPGCNLFLKMVDEIQLSIGPNWSIIGNEFDKPYYMKLMRLLYMEYYNRNCNWEIYPSIEKIFAWTRYCTIDEVKVVIIGQDPYPKAKKGNEAGGIADGLAFSDKTCSSGSLTNIFQLLKADIGGNITLEHGDLTQWAEQGVLLLNTVLTVQKGIPYSHCEMGWEKLTSAVVKYIYERDDKSVFLLWGTVAHNFVSKIEARDPTTGVSRRIPIDDTNPRIKTTYHPTPRDHYKQQQFYACKHFSKANKYLKSKDVPRINWNIY